MKHSHADVVRAQRKSIELLESVAGDDALFAAQRAMVAASGRDAGYAAYFGALYDAADQDGMDAAREAWDGSLAESLAYHAQHDADTSDDESLIADSLV
jgi:hypothetical protein